MDTLKELIENNRRWAAGVKTQNPNFFAELCKQQSPQYLWIGCSDSRVPANQIVGLLPGEVFVHRNVANLVVHTDFNCLSVIQYAVEVLKVKHIILCGHYGCGGIQAALGNSQLGLISNWLRHVKDIWIKHQTELSKTPESQHLNRLCELNVLEQVNNICHTTIVQQAWQAGQDLSVHGWIYGINDGLIQDLGICISHQDEIEPIYRLAANRGLSRDI